MAWYDRAQNALVGGAQGGAAGYAVGRGPGAVIGAGIGALAGLLSPTEQAELARKYARGEIPKAVQDRIAKTLAKRFMVLRTEQGADLARRGLLGSTAAGRVMAESYDAEREALSGAIADQTFNYQQIGFDLIARRNQDLQQGLGSAASVVGHKMLLDYYRNKPTIGTDGTGLGETAFPTPTDAVNPANPAMPGNASNPSNPLDISSYLNKASDKMQGGGGIAEPSHYSVFSGVNRNYSRRQAFA